MVQEPSCCVVHIFLTQRRIGFVCGVLIPRLHEYGEPTNMVHNGNIYRGCDPCGAAIVVTFYQSTFNVRVQGAGYAYWANKVLPKFAKVVMDQLQTPDDDSIDNADVTVRSTSHHATIVGSQSGSPSASLPSASVPNFSMYGESLLTSTPASTSTPRPQPKAQGPAQIPVSNRFSVLSDHHDNDTDSLHSDATEQSSPPSPLNAKTPTFISSRRKRKPASPQSSQPESSSEPNVVILGDSISRRIDSKRLLKKGNVTNLSKGGRRIDQVCDDINSHQATISTASSLIVHVGTNNLKHDSVDDIKLKLHKLKDAIKARAAQKCEIAFSSVIRRRDIRDSKVDAVNHILSDICDNNRWTYIDNSAIRKDVLTDDVHPNPKGMSYLARNLQDFLRCVYPHLFPRTIYPKWVTYLMS